MTIPRQRNDVIFILTHIFNSSKNCGCSHTNASDKIFYIAYYKNFKYLFRKENKGRISNANFRA